MPWAVAAAGVAAAGSVAGASMQSGAVNASSKSAARAQEEARIINQQNLTNTLGAVGPRLEAGGADANATLFGSDATARADLNNGYGAAEQRVDLGGRIAQGYLDQGRATIGGGVTSANALLQPYIDTGGRALGMVGNLSGANGVEAGRAALNDFQYSPAYQFNLDQGLRAIDAGAAAKGMLVSGGTRRAEQTYGAGLASREFDAYYQRLNNLAGVGQSASNQAGANIMTGAGNQAGFDRSSAANATSTQGALAALDSGWGAGLANNTMTTGGRVSNNLMNTGAAISNLYTGNATAQAANETGAANSAATLAASTGTALANIYGGASQGVGNAINSGMNNYAYFNALGPQNSNYSVTAPNAVYAPGQQALQTGAVVPNSGVVIR